MQWIDLREEQPPINENVLVCDKFNSFVSLGKLSEVSEDGETTFFLIGIDDVPIDAFITHWMLLPSPIGVLNEL